MFGCDGITELEKIYEEMRMSIIQNLKVQHLIGQKHQKQDDIWIIRETQQILIMIIIKLQVGLKIEE